MKHRDIKKLLDYWVDLKGKRAAPARSEIDPHAIRDILPSTFILSLNDDASCTYRLAGSQVCSLYCKELKGTRYTDPWGQDEQEVITSFIERLKRRPEPGLLEFSANNSRNNVLNGESLLLPLTQEHNRVTRLIGCTGIEAPPFWLGSWPLVNQQLLNLRNLPTSGKTLAAELTVRGYERHPPSESLEQKDLMARFAGRRYGSFVVIDGARS